mgnify:CR=1 FL=1|jgi:transcriptional regulator NrdR family protein
MDFRTLFTVLLLMLLLTKKGFVRNPYVSEKMFRSQLASYYLKTCDVIDKILDEAKNDIIRENYDKEKKEIIVDLVYNRINRIVTKFEELLFQFNVLYKKRIIISLDSFGYNEKLDYLLTLEETKEQNLDMDSID